jgi:hypothetical protein
VATHSTIHPDHGDRALPGLSLQDAAAALGISITTLRRHVKRGRVHAERIATPSGFVYRVLLDPTIHPSSHADDSAIRPPTRADSHVDSPRDVAPADAGDAMTGSVREFLEPVLAELAETRRLVERQQQTIMELSGRVGYYQGQIEALQKQLALQAPQPETVGRQAFSVSEPEPETEEPPRGWWGRAMAWLYG